MTITVTQAETIKNDVSNNISGANLNVYLLKRRGNQGNFDAKIFPNDINTDIAQKYSDTFNQDILTKSIVEYDSVHAEKGCIQFVKKVDLSYWANTLAAIAKAHAENSVLTKDTFSDDFNVIVIKYTYVANNTTQEIYFISTYKKIDSWFKKSIRFAWTANGVNQESSDIFVLNGEIDVVISQEVALIVNEGGFERIFNYHEKIKSVVRNCKTEIESWTFVDKPQEFYISVEGVKGATQKLARALKNKPVNFSQLTPTKIKSILSKHPQFSVLKYDKENRIVFEKGTRDLIIDILRHVYSNDLFTNSTIKTKGI